MSFAKILQLHWQYAHSASVLLPWVKGVEKPVDAEAEEQKGEVKYHPVPGRKLHEPVIMPRGIRQKLKGGRRRRSKAGANHFRADFKHGSSHDKGDYVSSIANAETCLYSCILHIHW